MTCPRHDPLHFCPLYTAGHDTRFAGITCMTGDWLFGCAVARGEAEYTDLVGLLRADPEGLRIVAQSEFAENAHQRHSQGR